MKVHIDLQLLATAYVLLLFGGVQGLTLSSTVAPDGRRITACPHTNITLTCTAAQTTTLAWSAMPGLASGTIQFVPDDTNNGSIVTNGAFTLTLVEVANRMSNRADLTSTMDVVVDGIENGTNVICQIFMNETSLLIVKESPPPPPANVMAVNNDFQTEIFSVLLSWEGRGAVEIYIISINTITQPIYTRETSIVVEAAEYNNPIYISVSAENCAGTSGEMIREIYEAGCFPPQAPVNGSVSEFTSSRVGAQVTYHCDTGLVPVGETVASCSSPSLQWLPSATDVMCIQTAASAPVGAIVAPVVVVVAVIGIGILVTVLVVVLYRRKSYHRKKSPGADNNEYNVGQELLSVRPDSSTSGTLPSSPRSPSDSSPGPMYDAVTTSNRAGPMYDAVTPDSPARPTPGSVFTNHTQNGSSAADRRAPPQHYSQPDNQPDNQTSHAQAATSSAGPRDDGRGNRNPPLMYAELGFADSKMQAPLNLTESGAVLHSEVGGTVPHSSHDPSTPTRPPKSSDPDEPGLYRKFNNPIYGDVDTKYK